MRLSLHERSIFRYRLLFVAGMLLCVYFSYHILLGERSYARLVGLRQVTAREQVHYAALQAEETALLAKVKMLRPGSVQPDYLEERARDVLGYRRADEMDVVAAPHEK